MLRRLPLTLLALCAALAFALPAQASPPKVYLNGVDITGLNNQEFENATIKLDADGNIYIEAPQYRVEVQGPNKDPAAAAAASSTSTAVTGNYFLVANHTPSGGSQFDVDVYVNGVLAKTIKNEEAQVILDISGKLSKGTNTVKLVAKKKAGVSATASTNQLEIFVGKGTSNPTQLTIDRQYFTFRVNGSQVSDVSESYTFEAF
ncbi:MAG: hypothetical protein RBU37_09325 [Myxococcota bacterium]|jgi:hypothetical protein|nr:hypothetical protein [Myxococcota bacterium]